MTAAPLILLVDDDPNDEDLARIALSRCGEPHQLGVARDGAEALDLLLGAPNGPEPRPDALPHLILLDLKLPKVSGLAVLKKLRQSERTSLVPVVVFTSSLQGADVQASYALGANGYICKPVDFAKYKALIAGVSSFWIRHNQPPAHGR